MANANIILKIRIIEISQNIQEIVDTLINQLINYLQDMALSDIL